MALSVRLIPGDRTPFGRAAPWAVPRTKAGSVGFASSKTSTFTSSPDAMHAGALRHRQNEKGEAKGFPRFAGDRTRTSTLLLGVDFESTASTNFATPAYKDQHSRRLAVF